METEQILSALSGVKKIAQDFSAFATVSVACDTIAALVNHEAELEARIAQLQQEKVDAEQAILAVAAEEQAKIDALKNAHAKYEAEMSAHRDKLRTEAEIVRTQCQEAIAAAKTAAEVTITAVDTELREATTIRSTERAYIVADHDAFVAETKINRAQIEANTAALQAKLDELRAELKPLMGQ